MRVFAACTLHAPDQTDPLHATVRAHSDRRVHPYHAACTHPLIRRTQKIFQRMRTTGHQEPPTQRTRPRTAQGNRPFTLGERARGSNERTQTSTTRVTVTQPADPSVWLATDFEDTSMVHLGPAAFAIARRLARTPTASNSQIELCESPGHWG